jgi:hypothetical protein
MGEMQPVKFRVAREPRAAAALAPPCRTALRRQAVAAEAVFGIVFRNRHLFEQTGNTRMLRRGRPGGKATAPRSRRMLTAIVAHIDLS